jgi:hypothetical protein
MSAVAAASSSGSGAIVVIYLLIFVLYFVGAWKVFVKAGQPGWGVIIPIYNIYLLCRIAGRPGWWTILFLVPLVNIIVSLVVAVDVAKAFNKSAGFGFGLWILGFIFTPILGFGSAQYVGSATRSTF